MYIFYKCQKITKSKLNYKQKCILTNNTNSVKQVKQHEDYTALDWLASIASHERRAQEQNTNTDSDKVSEENSNDDDDCSTSSNKCLFLLLICKCCY